MTVSPLLLALVAATAVALVGARLRPQPTRRTIVGVMPPRRNMAAPSARPSDTQASLLRRACTDPRTLRAITVLRRRSAGRVPPPRAVAEWCDVLARRIRSGSTLREALATTVPDDINLSARTDALRLALHRGRSVAEALAWRMPENGPHLELALQVLETAARVGGPSASPIDHLALVLRQRAADGDERVAQAAQAQLSAHVLTAIPLLMLALLVATDADVRVVMTSGIGIICLSIGVTLNVAGWWWMRRLVAVRW